MENAIQKETKKTFKYQVGFYRDIDDDIENHIGLVKQNSTTNPKEYFNDLAEVFGHIGNWSDAKNDIDKFEQLIECYGNDVKCKTLCDNNDYYYFICLVHVAYYEITGDMKKLIEIKKIKMFE